MRKSVRSNGGFHVKSLSKAVLTLALATGAVLGSAGIASARDICGGTYEIDGCQMCSYQGGVGSGMTQQPAAYCDGGYWGYYWINCNIYVAGVCVEGALQ